MACGGEFLDDVAADGFVYLLSRKAGFHTFAVTIRENTWQRSAPIRQLSSLGYLAS